MGLTTNTSEEDWGPEKVVRVQNLIPVLKGKLILFFATSKAFRFPRDGELRSLDDLRASCISKGREPYSSLGLSESRNTTRGIMVSCGCQHNRF